MTPLSPASRMMHSVQDTVFAPVSSQSTAATIAFSFQLMTRAEPPEIVIATIKSLLAVKQAVDEILIIDNNHTDKSLYQPLAAFCESLDAALNVRFYHIDEIAGYKAGALNLALAWMDRRCSHIVVVDSDYEALPHAREAMVQAINDYPEHTLLQFPQFYRSAHLEDIHSELNHYFNHHLYQARNRMRALSTGTYAVIRRHDLQQLGGWSGASITEDAQMGVLMHQHDMRSAFIPTVIATGLLPATLCDLLAQRQRWVYGNMQIFCRYLAAPLLRRLHPTYAASMATTKHSKAEQRRYQRAHLSQLSAWVNGTGILILLQLITVMLMALTLIVGHDSTWALPILAVIYTGYGVFLLRRLWAYLRDQAPLTQQMQRGYQHTIAKRLRTWLMHLNFWEVGALCWLPVLWGRQKPFVCTPKIAPDATQSALKHANRRALPKLLLTLNALTALLVSPLSAAYSPILFACALTVFGLKLIAARLALANYSAASEAEYLHSLPEPSAPFPLLNTEYVKPLNIQKMPFIETTDRVQDKRTINF